MSEDHVPSGAGFIPAINAGWRIAGFICDNMRSGRAPALHLEKAIRRVHLHFLGGLLLAASAHGADVAGGWPEHGYDQAGTRYSPLAQITRDNVRSLSIAWQYRTGEAARRGAAFEHAKSENILITAAGHLITCTPFNRVIALDPATGRERWHFDPAINSEIAEDTSFICRGVARWRDPAAPPVAPCAERLIFSTHDLRVFAIDARDGRRCAGFGASGEVALPPDRPLAYNGELSFASTPSIINGVIVIGSSIVDKYRPGAPVGKVQALDARTGAKRWEFHPIPVDPADPAMATWPDGGAARTAATNVWGHMAVDEARDLVFVPTSTPSPDMYGGLRAGDNRYANSIVALRGATGEVVWHFQVVHHSLWDYDLAAQPLLVDLPKDGAAVPALVQNTKQGLVFTFNRETGEPYFQIEERPVPRGDVPGEWYAPTQPFPVRPPPLVPHGASPEDAWGFTPWDRAACRHMIESLEHGPIYTPPGERGTVISPWTGGGVNWGGAAYDPARRWMIVNVNRMMKAERLVPIHNRGRSPRPSDDGIEWSTPYPLPGTSWAFSEALLLSPLGAPCNKPPWGELLAVDLVRGEIVWRVPLGTIARQLPLPIPWRLGTPGIGAPIVTAGGLVFIAATLDEKLRAFDVDTGEELWHTDLPAGAMTTPITFEVGGRQFVAIVAGGHAELPVRRGDYVIAFALPP